MFITRYRCRRLGRLMPSVVSRPFLRSSKVTRLAKQPLSKPFTLWMPLPDQGSVKSYHGFPQYSLKFCNQPVRISLSREGTTRPSRSVRWFVAMLSHCRYLSRAKGCPWKDATALLSAYTKDLHPRFTVSQTEWYTNVSLPPRTVALWTNTDESLLPSARAAGLEMPEGKDQ